MTLDVSNISKESDGEWLLRDVSVSFEPGKINAIFSTDPKSSLELLKIIGKDNKPTEGKVVSEIKRIERIPAENKKSSILGKFFFGNIDAATAEELNRLVNSAFTTGNKIVLIDGITSCHGPNIKHSLFERIRRKIKGLNSIVVIALNSFDDVLEVADNVAVIDNGYLAQFNTPQNVYTEPASTKIAGLTGVNNIFEARRLTSSKSSVPYFQTIEGGHRIYAQRFVKSSLGAINQNVSLAIRPEQISISFGASFPEDNLLKATITDIRPQGPTTFVHLDCGGLKLTALVLRIVGLSVGDECMVGLPPDRIQVLST